MVRNYWAPLALTLLGGVVLVIQAFYGHSADSAGKFLLGDLTVLAGNAAVFLLSIALVRKLLGASFGPLVPGTAKLVGIVTLLVASDAVAIWITGTSGLLGAIILLLAIEPLIRFVVCFFAALWLYDLDGVEAITLSTAALAVIPLEIIMCCTMGSAAYPLLEGLLPRC